MNDPGEVQALLAEQAARTTSRAELTRGHPRFTDVSPQVGALDEVSLAALVDDDLDGAAAMLVDMARATDPALRAATRQAAARLLVPPPRLGGAPQRGGARQMRRNQPGGMDLDLDATLDRLAGVAHAATEDIRWEAWSRPQHAYVLLVDASGSMSGVPLATAVVTAAAIASRLQADDQFAVIAFWSRAVLLRPMCATEPPHGVLDRLFDLRGGDTTNLAAGLRAALVQAAQARSARREVLVLTDGMANDGDDPVPVAATAGAVGARVHLLELSPDPASRAACGRVADAGMGRTARLERPSDAARAVATVLA